MQPESSRILRNLAELALVFIAVGLFALSSCVIFGDIHESGHALACFALGGDVGGFTSWLHGVLPFTNHPATRCSIKPFPALVWAGGPLASITEWLVSAMVLTLLLNASIIKPSHWGNVFWWIWSFWFLHELLNEVRHAYAPRSVWEDSTQFVYTTGINPNFVALPLAGLFVMTLWITWRIGKRLSEQASGGPDGNR